MNKLTFLGLVLALVLSSCIKEPEVIDYSAQDEETISNYLKENNISAERDPSGLYYQIIEEGGQDAGSAIIKEAYLEINYTGSYVNGEVFADYSNKVLSFNIQEAIDGWKIGIPKSSVGGRIKLFVPSALSNSGGGGETSVVIYDITILARHDDEFLERDLLLIEDYLSKNSLEATYDPKGIYYKVIEPGVGDKVTLDDEIVIKYNGYLLDSTSVDSKDSYQIPLENLIEGWQIGLVHIAKGGKVQLYIPSKFAYKSEAIGNVPKYGILAFDIEVLDIK